MSTVRGLHGGYQDVSEGLAVRSGVKREGSGIVVGTGATTAKRVI